MAVWGCRLHGVCKDNPLAPVIGKLRLPLYRTCGDNSVLYDHDLERYGTLVLVYSVGVHRTPFVEVKLVHVFGHAPN